MLGRGDNPDPKIPAPIKALFRKVGFISWYYYIKKPNNKKCKLRKTCIDKTFRKKKTFK